MIAQIRRRLIRDFSTGSLTKVEEALDEASGEFVGLSEDQAVKLVQWFGCYIPEVGRKQFRGNYLWHTQRDEPDVVVGEPTFYVAMIIGTRLVAKYPGNRQTTFRPFMKASPKELSVRKQGMGRCSHDAGQHPSQHRRLAACDRCSPFCRKSQVTRALGFIPPRPGSLDRIAATRPNQIKLGEVHG